LYVYVTNDYFDSTTHATPTGWRRPIGCLQLQVIFRKRATNYRALLRKMTYAHRASYGSSPPCSHIAHKSSNEWLRHCLDDATHILSIDMTHPTGVCPPIIRVSQPRIYSLPKPTDRTHKGVCLLRNALCKKVLPTFIHIGTR